MPHELQGRRGVIRRWGVAAVSDANSRWERAGSSVQYNPGLRTVNRRPEVNYKIMRTAPLEGSGAGGKDPDRVETSTGTAVPFGGLIA